eukprot:m.8012 g.8012  ORF g.8012 m.8012 type:complete len:318 (+) comp2245_c0_seq1:147-1100(+)
MAGASTTIISSRARAGFAQGYGSTRIATSACSDPDSYAASSCVLILPSHPAVYPAVPLTAEARTKSLCACRVVKLDPARRSTRVTDPSSAPTSARRPSRAVTVPTRAGALPAAATAPVRMSKSASAPSRRPATAQWASMAAMAVAGAASPMADESCLPVVQSRRLPSWEALTTRSPSQVMALMPRACPSSTATIEASSSFSCQILTVRSSPPVAASARSAERAMHVPTSSCPFTENVFSIVLSPRQCQPCTSPPSEMLTSRRSRNHCRSTMPASAAVEASTAHPCSGSSTATCPSHVGPDSRDAPAARALPLQRRVS